MVAYRIHYGFFLWALFFSVNLYSDSIEPLIKNTTSSTYNMMDTDHNLKFPINNNISLIIEVPNDLQSKIGQKNPSIPDGTGYFYWDASTYIAIFSITNIAKEIKKYDKYPSKGVTPVTIMLNNIIRTMKINTEATVLERGEKNYSSYGEGYLIVKRYFAIDARDAVVYVYFASGPKDAVLIYYTMYKGILETIDTLVPMLKYAMKTQVKIIDEGKNN